jgi:CBS domain containing-hemolysin-like protein
MVALETEVSVSGALVEALEAGYSRLPIYLDSIDDVVGIAYTKDLMRLERAGRGDETVGANTRAATFVPETMLVSKLLRQMQDAKVHQVIVVDEYGGTAGLVTLEDVIEELVGEIVDEFDVEGPAIEYLDDGSVVVAGRMAIDEVDDLLDAEFPKGTWDTIGGLLLDLCGGIPEEGETQITDGFRLTAQRLDGRRIERVQIERLLSTTDETEKRK